MRQTLRAHRWSGSVLVAAMALLTIGIGFCLFDADDHGAGDDGVSLDLCLGLAIGALPVVLLVFLVERLASGSSYVRHTVPLHQLDPPPKSLPLS